MEIKKVHSDYLNSDSYVLVNERGEILGDVHREVGDRWFSLTIPHQTERRYLSLESALEDLETFFVTEV